MVKKIDFFYNKQLNFYTPKMNDNTNSYLNNLYTHLNNNQYYSTYTTSIDSQPSYTRPEINQTIYDKLLHDFRNQ